MALVPREEAPRKSYCFITEGGGSACGCKNKPLKCKYVLESLFSVSKEIGTDSMSKVDPRKSTRNFVDRARLSLLLK